MCFFVLAAKHAGKRSSPLRRNKQVKTLADEKHVKKCVWWLTDPVFFVLFGVIYTAGAYVVFTDEKIQNKHKL